MYIQKYQKKWKSPWLYLFIIKNNAFSISAMCLGHKVFPAWCQLSWSLILSSDNSCFASILTTPPIWQITQDCLQTHPKIWNLLLCTSSSIWPVDRPCIHQILFSVGLWTPCSHSSAYLSSHSFLALIVSPPVLDFKILEVLMTTLLLLTLHFFVGDSNYFLSFQHYILIFPRFIEKS